MIDKPNCVSFVVDIGTFFKVYHLGGTQYIFIKRLQPKKNFVDWKGWMLDWEGWRNLNYQYNLDRSNLGSNGQKKNFKKQIKKLKEELSPLGKCNYNYIQSYSKINFEDVLENVTPSVQQNLLFNLDWFLNNV